MSTSLSSHGFNTHTIPKLEGSSNYKTWRMLCTSSLISSGIWKYVEGTPAPPVRIQDEKDHVFQDRLELFGARAEQARMIIISSCKTHIQHSLDTVKTAKECWEKLKTKYEEEGLVHVHHIWLNFTHCNYNGEPIEEFCNKYRDALELCKTAEIEIQPKIQTCQFIDILDSYFPQWALNKRELMRRQPKQIPDLELLIKEVVDEFRLKDEKRQAVVSPLTLQNSQSTRRACTHCGLSRHSEERCFYKHSDLRPQGWKLNAEILKRIEARERPKSNNVHAEATEDSFFGNMVNISNRESFHLAQLADRKGLWIADSDLTSTVVTPKSCSKTMWMIRCPSTLEMALSSPLGRATLISDFRRALVVLLAPSS